ncbi:hypothetical protein SAMN05428975_5579 [Mucilaginibacter sp. OK268]|nr:hypothetical protein SAMN05428975_5579 [Mucilaginibacter sp. OK268]
MGFKLLQIIYTFASPQKVLRGHVEYIKRKNGN